MAVEDFGGTPEEFDLDAWIAQGTRVQRTVKVYRDWGLMDELARLETAIAAAEEALDRTISDAGPDELREEFESVLEKLAESALEVTLRSLTNEEVRTITAGIPDVEVKFRDQHGKEQTRWKPDQVAVGDALVAEAAVSPVLSRDQVRKMRQTLGDGPTLVLYQTVGELREAGKDLPSVPFSPAVSGDSQE